MTIDRAHLPIIAAFIEQLASRSEGYAYQAGVGGMEIAGGLLSYLAEHPKDLEPFINGGIFELPPNWFELGGLTWLANNGKVTHPQTARDARIINRMKAPTP